jgi:beta-lactamase regulating signal transducer with metallopeptidase domain
MAHVARFDALWLALQHILQAVYFFHPLVWISGAKLNEERERLCDATVVSAGRLTARNYVGGLLNVLRLDLQGVEAPTMTAEKRRIGVRIQNIIERPVVLSGARVIVGRPTEKILDLI